MKSFIFSVIAIFIAASSLFANVSEYYYYHIKNTAFNKQLTVGNRESNAPIDHGNNQPISQYSPTNEDLQKWEFIATKDGYFFIKNKQTNKYLEAMKNGNRYDGHVYQYEFDGTNSQKWKLIFTGHGYFLIKNKRTGKFLQSRRCSSGNKLIVQARYNGAFCQKWKLVKCEAREFIETDFHYPNEFQYYTIKTNSRGNLMDIEHNSTSNNGKAISHAPDYTSSQKWKFKATGDGYFFIKNKRSGKYLDAMKNGNQYDGNVYQYRYDGTDSQKWELVPFSFDGGFCDLKNKRTGKSLRINSCRFELGYLTQTDKNECVAWKITPPRPNMP